MNDDNVCICECVRFSRSRTKHHQLQHPDGRVFVRPKIKAFILTKVLDLAIEA